MNKTKMRKNIQRHTLMISRKRHKQPGRIIKYFTTLVLCSITLFIFAETHAAAGISGAYYLYNLSDFSGTIPYSWAGLSVDKNQDEVYVIYKNDIEIFNNQGMKVYSFGDDENISGVVYDVAIDKDGTIYLLLIDGDTYSIMRCNYRGEAISEIKLRNFPPDFSEMYPTRLVLREGNLYLADLMKKMQFVVMDTNGLFRDGYDINALIKLDEFEGRPGQEKEIVGFNVDKDGNILFTIPTIFKAFILSPDRKIQTFGEKGNIPGKFSVVAGIASDDAGNIYVTDTLKSVVMIFNKDFNFIIEFGYRGDKPDNLIAPNDMVVNNGHVYISQSRKRGISVYRIVQN